MEETPAWAVYGAAEKGFDPAEIRFLRNKAKAPSQVPLKLSSTSDTSRVVSTLSTKPEPICRRKQLLVI